MCDLQHSDGLTVLCASHDLQVLAEHADTLVLLDGDVLTEGPPAVVLESAALERAYAFPAPHAHSVTPTGVERGGYQASLLTLSPVTDFLSYGFIQRALITGTLLGVSCAVLAFFVVLRRMAFIGVGISHAALGGVALGVVLGISPVLAATVFSVGVAWVIGWIAARGRISEDTAIGIFFPTAMALGVALISLSPTYRKT